MGSEKKKKKVYSILVIIVFQVAMGCVKLMFIITLPLYTVGRFSCSFAFFSSPGCLV